MSAEFELPDFQEPTELQEWYDIGADIRINLRTQFSKLRRLALEQHSQSQTQIEELNKRLGELEKERDAYAMSMKIALKEGVFTSKEELKKKITETLKHFLGGPDESEG